ncbi:TetR/AcrR family transcriptional regulator [Microbacterium sp. SLBN-146]|uniref:TetR/AcrR family transcriptional regulator n=1 Tax=Microbacterium sp. SLBN-146 TaxID=2768457 RepID=UPI0011538C55|nr:TetR family transcriptional regulator [Microbacterium sp. SLBN-146]TQJ32139.1 TetR family transcriptional regulator [Microbacterium sp. SLBN-146]
MFSSEKPPATKSDRTRAHIREVALASFRERGYDATTIRLIAQEAGVSVGTTNYHFASKNNLVQELYLDVQRQHRDAAMPLLADAQVLIDRLEVVYRTGIDQLAPYHAHAPEFLSAAVSPRSPINPLSAESAPALAIVEGLFRDAVEGAGDTLPSDVRSALPHALVLAHLLLALFWVYDSSPGQRRTRALVEQGLRLLKLVLPLTRVPMLRAPVRQLLALIADVRAGS